MNEKPGREASYQCHCRPPSRPKPRVTIHEQLSGKTAALSIAIAAIEEVA